MDTTNQKTAKMFLLKILDKNDTMGSLIIQEGLKNGISYASLRKAKGELGIGHYKIGKIMFWKATTGLIARQKKEEKSLALYKLFVGVSRVDP